MVWCGLLAELLQSRQYVAQVVTSSEGNGAHPVERRNAARHENAVSRKFSELDKENNKLREEISRLEKVERYETASFHSG